jgi:pyridoxamine 5'-phosphate oxidase family protein
MCTAAYPRRARRHHGHMSVFSEAEIAYLQNKTMGRLATIGADGRPHLVPLTYRFNADEDAVDIGGVDFANSKKWRDMLQNPHVAFLVDDASAEGAHAIEIRGNAEPHFIGGELINPRFPSFKPEFVRVRPQRIVSWGLETQGFVPYARNVS